MLSLCPAGRLLGGVQQHIYLCSLFINVLTAIFNVLRSLRGDLRGLLDLGLEGLNPRRALRHARGNGLERVESGGRRRNYVLRLSCRCLERCG